jgi:tetratricopeptide (TPR) repeat protein
MKFLGGTGDLHDRYGQARTWDSLGNAHHHLGHHTEASVCYDRSLDLFRALGDRYNEATTLTRLGETHRVAGALDAARGAWRHALDILDELGHPDAEPVGAKLRRLTDPP